MAMLTKEPNGGVENILVHGNVREFIATYGKAYRATCKFMASSVPEFFKVMPKREEVLASLFCVAEKVGFPWPEYDDFPHNPNTKSRGNGA